MQWALDYPTRFLLERAAIDRLEAETDWLSSAWRFRDGVIAVDLDLRIHGCVYEGVMTYPVTFPDSPPYIRPRDISQRWSGHQYGAGGPLCLEWRADNWHPSVTGADMVRSAYELLNAEQHPELPREVPSAHRLTEGQNMRGAVRRFVATAGFLATCEDLALLSRRRLKSASIYHRGTMVSFVAKVEDAAEELQDVADIPKGISASSSLFSIPRDGSIFRSEAFDLRHSITTVDEVVRVLADAGFATDDILIQEAGEYKARTVVLLGTELPSLRVIVIDSGEYPEMHENRVVWSSSSDGRLSDETQKFANSRVGIVGLGSVGSKIAISLARSGVRRFLLVDDDYLDTGNMVRHELSWSYVGSHKVEAVRDMLTLVAAGVQVDVNNSRMAGQESPMAASVVLRDLSKCDLLIDATANPEVFLLLAALAKRNGTPLCWGEIFAGGFGGMIARARPGRDPNPLATRDAYYAHLATLPDAPFKNAAGYDGSEEQPLVAHDSDVGFVASSLTRLVIDTLLVRDPSDFPNSVYLLGMRNEWIFDAPFDTHPIEVAGPGWEPEDNAVSDADKHAVAEQLLRMLEGEESAHAGTSD